MTAGKIVHSISKAIHSDFPMEKKGDIIDISKTPPTKVEIPICTIMTHKCNSSKEIPSFTVSKSWK